MNDLQCIPLSFLYLCAGYNLNANTSNSTSTWGVGAKLLGGYFVQPTLSMTSLQIITVTVERHA